MGKTNLVIEPGKQEFTVTRVFDAPPALVYKAYTDPNLLRQWLGPRDLKMTELQMEVKPGGTWRFVHSDDQGNAYHFFGVFHTVEPNTRLVRTFEFLGAPGHISLESAVFEEEPGGKTRLTTHAVYQSVEDRDGMVDAGMEGGMNEGWDRLDQLLAEAQRGKAPAR